MSEHLALAARLTQELEAQFAEGARLEEQIRKNLKNLEGV